MSVEEVQEQVQQIAAWPEVAPLIEQVRDACTQLRWHPALRRRIPECATESRVRGARASAELDGGRVDDMTVRLLLGGETDALPSHDGASEVVRGAVRATAESEHLVAVLRRSPAQALSRLHVAAATSLSPAEQVGRPRAAGEEVGELVDVGPLLPAEEVAGRLRGVADLLAATSAPAFVVAALVHAEVATLRPFVRGNGLVARALERSYVVASGLDPTGVTVPEVGHGLGGHAAYGGALAAYATGSRAGLIVWLEHESAALLGGAEEGRRIADAVLAGRLG